MSQHRAEPLPLHDLDATDRLPVLDPTGPGDDDPYATTGTWVAPDAVAIAEGDAGGTLSRLIGERDDEITRLTDALREKSLAADRLECELGQARDELARLRSETDQQLQTAGARAMELDRARLELAAQLDASRVALASLEQRATEAERLAAGLADANARDRDERESLAASLAASRAAHERLEEQAVEAKSERDRLATEVAALAERLSAAERTAAQSRDEQSATLLKERDDAERAKLALQAALAAVQGELAEARSALHQSRTALERALEGRRTAEALRQYASDFRHALPSRQLRRELAAASEQVQALAARLATMEAAQAELRAAGESSLRELYARLKAAEEARDSAERRADELAVRARDAEETLAAVDAGEDLVSPADQPTIAREDPDALARKLEELSGEVARRDDRIVTLEAELRAQSEALETIRRGLGALGAGRSTGDDGEPDATLPRRYLVPLDDDSRSVCVLDRRRITVGRTPENGLTIQEPYISRLHAVLRLGPEVTVVEDAASTNGVFVNDHRVHRQLLHDGDIVAFGKMRFRFQLQPVVGDG